MVKAFNQNCLGVIFDMDGTLTKPGAIDYQVIFDRIGIQRENGDILF